MPPVKEWDEITETGVTVRHKHATPRESVFSRVASFPGALAGGTAAVIGAATDRVIGVVSPEREYHRLMFRKACSSLRGFDSGDTNRLNAHRVVSHKDADSEIDPKLARIRSLSREEGRNNGFARNARRAHRNNVVGDADVGQGITVDPAVLAAGETEKENEPLNTRLKQLWEERRDCLEYTGMFGFTDLLSVFDQELFESGAVLAILHERPAPGSDIPFSIEVVEIDRLPMDSETMGGGTWPVSLPGGKPQTNIIRHGIEWSPSGQIVAFHILKDHPGKDGAWSTLAETQRWPAEKVVYYFAPDRAEQTRGVSNMVAGLATLADTRDLATWELVAARMAACFGVVFKGTGVPANVPYSQNQGTTPPQDLRGNAVTEIQPGVALSVGPGGDVSMFQGNRPGNTFLPFWSALTRWFAASVGMGYSTVSKDYTGLSFSALRQEALEDRRGYRTDQGLVVRHALKGVGRKGAIWPAFVTACVRAGLLKDVIEQRDWEQNPKRYFRCDIQCPGWDYVNPLQEATADSIGLATGMKCLDEIPNASGMEPNARLRRLGAQKKLALEQGLTPTWAFGVAKPRPNGGATPPAEKTKVEGAAEDAAEELVDAGGDADAEE